MDEELVVRIERVAERKGVYRPEAYFWLLRALEFSRRRLRRAGHVSGRELLEGTRLLALEDYGPMAREVFEHWGLTCSEDVGRIVFDLIDEGLLNRTEEDRIEDFAGVYDFRQVFSQEAPW
jgi:uncharacterized repeat protein (TIGR04138 family)